MKSYVASIPRRTFGFAAVAMTALTLGMSVVVPASLASGNETRPQAAAPYGVASEIAISPSRIEVIGVREQNTAQEPGRQDLRKQPLVG